MNGFYNVIFGRNPATPALIVLAGFRPPLPELRLRDAFLERHGDEPLIHVYTRIGGPNRDTHSEAWVVMRAMPNYVRDADDEYDPTYAGIWFRPTWDIFDSPEPMDPTEKQEAIDMILSRCIDPVDTAAMWAAGIEALAQGVGGVLGTEVEVEVVEIELDP